MENSDSQPVPSVGYLGRHWTGDNSLAASYLLTGLLANVVLAALNAVSQGVSLSTYPIAGSAIRLALFPITWATIVWLFVGTWRSAGKHESRGGKAAWAGLARVGMAIGAISVVASLVQTPTLLGIAASAFLESVREKPYRFTLGANGKEVEVRGLISFGLTQELRAFLDSNPRVGVAHLVSTGGRILEAREMGRLFSERRIATNAPAGCYSACALAFLGGTRRTISATGDLGFHMPQGVEDTFGDVRAEFDAIVRSDREFMIARGIDPDFVNRAYSTPNSDMWRPSRRELFEAGVITEIAAPNDYSVIVDPNGVEAELLKARIFRVLKQHEREEWEALLEKVRPLLAEGASMEAVRAQIMPVVSGLLGRRAPHASDEVLIEFGLYLVDSLQELSELGADACYGYLFPAETGGRVTLSREMVERELEVLADVIESAARGPRAIPTVEEVGADLTEVFASFGDEDIAVLSGGAADPARRARACEVSLTLYRKVVALPPERAARLLRFLLGSEE